MGVEKEWIQHIIFSGDPLGALFESTEVEFRDAEGHIPSKTAG